MYVHIHTFIHTFSSPYMCSNIYYYVFRMKTAMIDTQLQLELTTDIHRGALPAMELRSYQKVMSKYSFMHVLISTPQHVIMNCNCVFFFQSVCSGYINRNTASHPRMNGVSYANVVGNVFHDVNNVAASMDGLAVSDNLVRSDDHMRRSNDAVAAASSSSLSSSYANIVHNSVTDESNDDEEFTIKGIEKLKLFDLDDIKDDGFDRDSGDKDSDNNNNSSSRSVVNDDDPFLFILTEEDEQICMNRAEAILDMRRNLEVKILDDLIDVYKANDKILIEHAQEYLRSLPQQIEADKQQATEDWLKGKTQKEKEQYLQRHGQG